jgi:hypothetical protein
MSVSGTAQNLIAASTDHLAVPFHASKAFTPLSFDFEVILAPTGAGYAGVIFDPTGTVVAMSTTVGGTANMRTMAFTTNPLLPAGLYYQMLYTDSTYLDGGLACFGTPATNKIPNLRAMGCFSVSMNFAQKSALAIGQSFTLNSVVSTVMSSVPNMWVRCLTNV